MEGGGFFFHDANLAFDCGGNMLAALYSVSPVLLILLSCCFSAAMADFGRREAKFS
jgi:hypothetical protein